MNRSKKRRNKINIAPPCHIYIYIYICINCLFSIVFNPVESCATLLSNDLKRHLFNLFASWSGPTAKPLGVSYHGSGSGTGSSGIASNSGISGSYSINITGTSASGVTTSIASNICAEEEKLQFGALQVNLTKKYFIYRIVNLLQITIFVSIRQCVPFFVVDHVLMVII